ncbi:2OG-Fe(II) oxygenase [Galbibacter pacificus]|uniref:2OG-Fe(II) oxygenase n=1 Tax=Galbibacter pacificus TaxID=2996052 RepID=A0ABT6FVC0_9FLAO|nr:2OG-Fe(II) oxygenase [Galbibacter pacificus]MDG3583869.1 2OG-Fe(II) oxygenase [Galbibacter pacificus]MDG3587213.1 2OG-Fe(II) oxygenase [Galbibacter pacificus]
MESINTKIETIDWNTVTAQMHEKGYAIVPKFINQKQCNTLTGLYPSVSAYRKTVVMERYRFGLGEYKYFNYPLPKIVREIRQGLYPKLAPIANLWMKVLKIDRKFPETLQELLEQCHKNNQLKPTPLILKYGKGGFNTLHQDLYGDIYFPLQAVLFLDQPDIDYSGGEFVLTQQTPRAQSKAMVLRPQKGDMLIFTTNFRPIKGTKGYYRARIKHGVSQLHHGQRHTLGIIFHDALS